MPHLRTHFRTKLATLLVFFATVVWPVTFSTPTIDGQISADWSGDELIIDDSSTDSPWAGSDVDDVYLTWDASNLYIAIRHTLANNGLVLYLDAGTPGSDGTSNAANLDSWPRNIQFSGFVAEFLYGKWNDQVGNFYHLASATMTQEVSSQVQIATSGANGASELGVPWEVLYGLGAGHVSTGARIKLVAALVGGDGTSAHDTAPDNANVPPAGAFDPTLLNAFYSIQVDQNNDGLPDPGIVTGIGQGISWNPQNPNPNDVITLTITNATQGGKLHWGVNGIDGSWSLPLPTYRPANTVVFDAVSVETALQGPDANGVATVQIGPFTDARQVVRSIDFVIHWNDDTWDNNNGADYRLTPDLTPQTGDATLAFVQPDAGAKITGAVTVEVSASGETSVEMRADSLLILQKSAPPYSTAWDPFGNSYGRVFLQASAKAANGRYTMTAIPVYYDPVVLHTPAPAGIKHGASDNGDGTVTFALFAPGKRFVTIKGDWNGWDADAEVMSYDDAKNLWWKTVNVGNGDHTYQYVIEGGKSLADPYATDVDWTVNGNEDGFYGNAKTLVAVGAAPFAWSDAGFTAPAHKDWVIYEVHTGDFSATGDFAGIQAKLDYLQDLGVNAVELMPPYEFPGGRSWGYNPAFHMAVESAYGTPEDFKRLVDAAHQRGIVIIIDMVFNHMDASAPLYQLYENDYAASPWFHDLSNPWGFPDMDHWSADTHDYTRDVVGFWIDEYHVDGFRYDATWFIGWDAAGNGVTGFTQSARNAKANIYNMAEHLPQDVAMVQQTETDAEWHDTFHDQMKANLREGPFEGSTYPDLNRTAQAIHFNGDGFSAPTEVINYTENHDEQRVIWEVQTNPAISYNDAVLKSKLGAVLLFTSAGVPMLYQGQEFGEDSQRTIDANPLHWEYLQQPVGSDLHTYFSRLIWLHQHHAALSANFLNTDLKDTGKNVIIYRREALPDKIVVAANLSGQPQTLDIPVPDDGTWYEYTNDSQFSASGGIISNITLPASTALIFVNNRDWGENNNQPPVAVAQANPTSGTAPLTVQFTGSGSSDPDGSIASFAWDFGDGTGTSTQADPQYTYTTAGAYNARLIVSDDRGLQDTAFVSIAVDPAGNQPPAAVILSPPAGVTIARNRTVHIAGDAIDPEDGSIPAANFVWTADLPNGQQNYPVASGVKSMSATAQLIGTYTLRLQVTDTQGSVTVKTVMFSIAASAANVPPVAYATASPASGAVPLTVNFESSLSTDPDGTISSRSWDFGDGATSTVTNPSHTYNSVGVYSAILTVIDNNGANGKDTVLVTVTGGSGNQKPHAVATANPTSGTAPLAVQFSGSGSSDPDGNIVSYSWDFGDGAGSSAQANPQYTYNSGGNFTARLIVTDNGGSKDTAFVAITVSAPVNQSPVATITQPSNGGIFVVNQTVNFSGSATDPEDGDLPAANFTWTVIIPNGQERPLATGVKSGAGVPTAPGSYTIKLQVHDSQGLVATTQVAIVVNATAKAKVAQITDEDFALTGIPLGYQIFAPYPNPFAIGKVRVQTGTVIEFGLPNEEKVTLVIYNTLGQIVATLLDGAPHGPGYHAYRWDGRDLRGQLVPSGVYFLRIIAGPLQQIRKMSVLQ